jgi:hypothetical protein
MKITFSFMTLLVVLTCIGIAAAQMADGQAARGSDRPANDESDVASLRDGVNNGWACIQMPGDEVDGVLHEMPPEKMGTAKVTYNDATGLYEILYQYDDPWSIDYYGKNCCLQTKEGQRNVNAFLARREAASKAEAAHMKKALADLRPYTFGYKSRKWLEPYICGGPFPGDTGDANGKNLGPGILVSVADPKNISLVQSLLPSSIDDYRVQATFVMFAPDTFLPLSDEPCSSGAPCEDKCEFPCDSKCLQWCPASCKSH